MSIDEMIEVLQAYKEGKAIEFKERNPMNPHKNPWMLLSKGHPTAPWLPDFYSHTYRIKPETGKDRLINEILALRDKSVGKDESIQLVGLDWLEAIAERIEKGEYDDFLGGE